MTDDHFRIGEKVQKKSGYKWPGTVVSVFSTLKSEIRYVVESTIPEVEGALHIYSGAQLERRPVDSGDKSR